MNYKKACELLEVNNDVSLENIKKQYKLKALLYHPEILEDDDISLQEVVEWYIDYVWQSS